MSSSHTYIPTCIHTAQEDAGQAWHDHDSRKLQRIHCNNQLRDNSLPRHRKGLLQLACLEPNSSSYYRLRLPQNLDIVLGSHLGCRESARRTKAFRLKGKLLNCARRSAYTSLHYLQRAH